MKSLFQSSDHDFLIRFTLVTSVMGGGEGEKSLRKGRFCQKVPEVSGVLDETGQLGKTGKERQPRKRRNAGCGEGDKSGIKGYISCSVFLFRINPVRKI